MMDRDEHKEVLRQFGLPYWDELSTEDALLAIMKKLLAIESQIENIQLQRERLD